MLPYLTGSVRVTSPYGRRVLFGRSEMHRGIDLVGDPADKTVRAVADGVIGRSLVVTDPGNRTSEWGEYVRLDLADGRMVYYCHLSRRLVRAGQTIRAGEAIGVEGATGKVTGGHLHFEVRKSGVAIDPTGLLGIPNETGAYAAGLAEKGNVGKSSPTKANAGQENTGNGKENAATSYTRDGLTFVPVTGMKIVYHDAGKRDAPFRRYANGGFFAKYKSESGVAFTLPVGNLCCDIPKIPAISRKYLAPHVENGKLRYECNENQSAQFHGKAPSTLVIPERGAPYVAELAAIPKDARYAISGVPTVRRGDDVDYHRFVKAQGWDESCMVPGWRHWIGIKNGKLWHIYGQTKTRNYIYGMEVWKKLQNEGFTDVLCLDGGGSYYRTCDGRAQTTAGNRQINTVVVFG